MAKNTFFGKQKLCYTEVSDFTDFQGIGRDPMYKRYDSVFSVVKRVIPENLHHFLATPEYSEDEDQIFWHVDTWTEFPIRLSDLSGEKQESYKKILDDTIKIYKSSIMDCNGEDLQIIAGALKYIDADRVYCGDGKVYLIAWGMTPDIRQHKVIGSVIHEFDYVKKFQITFDAGEYGTISKLDKCINRAEGVVLNNTDVPTITTTEGWQFLGWSPSPIGHVVDGDITFTAQYTKIDVPTETPETPIQQTHEQVFYNCRFDADKHGSIEGVDNIRKLENSRLQFTEIPKVKPNKGYEFTGWNITPSNCLIDEDKIFIAQYKEQIPWYKRWWQWLKDLFTNKGCLKWLLWILLGILLLYLLSLLRLGCSDHFESSKRKEINGVKPIDTIVGDDGKTRDDNGYSSPITDGDGKLPDKGMIVSPIRDENGGIAPIVENPGAPSIIANRLFLFMEDENGNVEALALDFKTAYPSEQYSIIGYDKEVKLLVIQVPQDERNKIRETINDKIPNHNFIVFDEEIYEIKGKNSPSSAMAGWHINAIHLQEGWEITKGSEDIKIAIVDDGIEANHPMFKNKIVDAYNVFTQNNKLSLGSGHGTHTAGLAGGSAEFINKGATGVAPNCMIMPIQVFDNHQCSLSALVAGVMYAVHHDADVVNISIGPHFNGLDALPVEEQDQIAKTQFKNVEKLWTRVCSLAAHKKCILVFAAGNDNILSSLPPNNRNQSAIVVTAIDKRMYPTDFTNYGPCSDISAPGIDIYSSFPQGDFQYQQGTSQAAPIVAGTIALMKTLKKDLSVEQIRNVLYGTGADVYGWIPPMVLVDEALKGVQRGDFNPPVQRPIKPIPNGREDGDSKRTPSPPTYNEDDNPTFERNPRDENISPNPTDPERTPADNNETDYDAIRRKIAEYKKKIEDLEKLLPKK